MGWGAVGSAGGAFAEAVPMRASEDKHEGLRDDDYKKGKVCIRKRSWWNVTRFILKGAGTS